MDSEFYAVESLMKLPCDENGDADWDNAEDVVRIVCGIVESRKVAMELAVKSEHGYASIYRTRTTAKGKVVPSEELVEEVYAPE